MELGQQSNTTKMTGSCIVLRSSVDAVQLDGQEQNGAEWSRFGVAWSRMERSGSSLSKIERTGSGLEWTGAEWSGVRAVWEQNGAEWSRLERSGAE